MHYIFEDPMEPVDQFIPVWIWPYQNEYNCSSIHPSGHWWTVNYGVKQTVFGWYSMIYGLICELFYIPCVLALHMEIKSTCYKIMLWLAIIDMIALFANSLSFGYFMTQGFVYCSSPVFVTIVGLTGLGVWCAASAGCLLLVSNRMLDLLRMHHIFEGRTGFYLCLATLYGFYFALFTPPLFTNSKHMAMFFDPFIGDGHPELFPNFPHTVNNLLIVTASTGLYLCLCILLVFKKRAHMTAKERKSLSTSIPVFIQASLICSFNVVASLIYVYMNFFLVSDSLIVLGQICWQLSHGAPPFIYLILNKTVRRNVKQLFFGRKKLSMSSMSAIQSLQSGSTARVIPYSS